MSIKDKLHENLSALMDDDLSDQERDHLIAKIARDDELLVTWSGYHLIKDSLQGQVHDFTTKNLAASISQKIEQEPVILLPKSRKPAQWQRPLAGFAIAASVALVAVLGVRSIDAPTTSAPLQTAQLDVPSRVTVAADISPEFALPSNPPATVEFVRAVPHNIPSGARLNSYMVNHYERKSNFGVLPYVRIVGYEPRSK